MAVPGDFEAKLVARMTKLAEQHPRWGYRMIHGLLVAEGWAVNKKRVERLWRQEGLQVPPRRLKASGGKAIGQDANSAWGLPALTANHAWSYDFVAARTGDGAPLRILNVIDEHTRQALGSHVARSIGAGEVRQHLERLFAAHGRPAFLRADNGREFVADSLREWLTGQGVQPVFIAKASPQQNCYIERFNGSMRRELLNAELFDSVLQARVVIGDWVELYNTRRAHRGLGGLTPDAYAKLARARVRESQDSDRPGGGE